MRRARLATIALLALTALASCVLLASRMALTGHWTFRFMAWNLFLAWIPLGLAWTIDTGFRRRVLGTGAALLLGALWLLFLPNALYIVTDLLHLKARDPVPLWFDLLLLLSFAGNGVAAGYLSLYLLQHRVARRLGHAAGWVFALAALGLSGVGVYMGRFLQFNSWDLLLRPVDVLWPVLAALRHPVAHWQSLAISALFAAFFILAYVVLFACARLPLAVREQVRPGARTRGG